MAREMWPYMERFGVLYSYDLVCFSSYFLVSKILQLLCISSVIGDALFD